MKSEAITQAIHTKLQAYARDNKGRASVARDPFDVMEVLWAGPEGFLIVLHEAGDDPEDMGLSESDADSIPNPIRDRMEVTVGYGLGLDVNRDWRLIAGKGNRPGLLGHVRAVRAQMLALVFPDDEEQFRRLRYDGREAVTTPEGVPLAAYRMKFSLVETLEVAEDIVVEEAE